MSGPSRYSVIVIVIPISDVVVLERVVYLLGMRYPDIIFEVPWVQSE